ncbi:MAG: protein-disulfide reductase DsbD [Halieaceae bacterium]|nr:protein-disulfide reductase DsbD [Halieaceae bacterium]
MRALLAGFLLLVSLLPASVLVQAQPGGLAGSPFGQAGSSPQFLPVEEAYRIELEVLPDKSLRVVWLIADSYYLYQHRFSFKLSDASGDIPVAVELPPALQREDEYFGQVQVYYQQADILLVPERAPQVATLALGSQGCADAGLCYPPQTHYFTVDFTTGTATATSAPRQAEPATLTLAGETASGSLAYMLLLAFVGGAILNLMPCVFPILSLKVLSFARSSAHDRHVHSWVYAVGVVTSFVLVAGLLIALQQAGQAIGWGFQLQSPGFVIALAYLFIAMGLSLSGLVEFGGSLMNTGSGLADRGGLTGSFFTGVLAVVVASPCTAPFMGTALGFAISQPPYVALLVFAALGAGMAAPLLLLGYSGLARRIMPKPGAWMDTLKQLLAFPLYGTAIWLLWVAGRQTGVNTMTAALAGALILALGLWLWRFGKWGKAIALACLLGALGLGSWRALDENGVRATEVAGRIPWSEQTLAELRASGTPVFVDVTADWCITCLANESAVLLTDEMTAAFAAHGVAYMVADWTNYDADIAAFLRRHKRNGIPLYLMYPADPALEPLLLPQILTRNVVLDALRTVSPQKPTIAVN